MLNWFLKFCPLSHQKLKIFLRKHGFDLCSRSQITAIPLDQTAVNQDCANTNQDRTAANRGDRTTTNRNPAAANWDLIYCNSSVSIWGGLVSICSNSVSICRLNLWRNEWPSMSKSSMLALDYLFHYLYDKRVQEKNEQSLYIKYF